MTADVAILVSGLLFATVIAVAHTWLRRRWSGRDCQTWSDRLAAVLVAVGVAVAAYSIQQHASNSFRRRTLELALRQELIEIAAQTKNVRIETFAQEPGRLRQIIAGVGAPSVARGALASGLFLDFYRDLAAVDVSTQAVMELRDRVLAELEESESPGNLARARILVFRTTILHEQACQLLKRIADGADDLASCTDSLPTK